MSEVSNLYGFALPDWAKSADLNGAKFCEKCSTPYLYTMHPTPGDCPYTRTCVVCGKLAGNEPFNDIVTLGWPSTHDGEAVCVACIDKWLDGAKSHE